MRRYAFGSIVAFMLFGLIGGIYQPKASAAEVVIPAGSTVIVDDSPYVQGDPHISDTLIVYTSQASNSVTDSEVRYYDLATGAGGVIPGGEYDVLADVFGDTIVFSRTLAYRAPIFAFDVTTGAITDLDPQPDANRRQADIGGSTVAWEDFGPIGTLVSTEIVIHDLVTESTTRLTDDELLDLNPMVSADGSVIVWRKCQTTKPAGCDIWQATRTSSTWVITQLTSGGDEETSPATNGEVVVYLSTKDGETDIAWQPLGGGTEQRLSLPGQQTNPAISGNLISFSSKYRDAGALSSDITVYDLSADVLYPITQTAERFEGLNDISVGDDGLVRVVYESYGSGGPPSIYAFTFDLPSLDRTPPTLSLPEELVVDATGPEGAVVHYDVTAEDDTDPNPSLYCEPPSGSVFPIGTSEVVCTAVDASGNDAGGDFRVTVRGAEGQIDNLEQLIEKFDLHHGIENSLLKKLQNGERQLAGENSNAACGMLGALIDHAYSQVGKSLTYDQAKEIIEAATRIRTVIGCS